MQDFVSACDNDRAFKQRIRVAVGELIRCLRAGLIKTQDIFDKLYSVPLPRNCSLYCSILFSVFLRCTFLLRFVISTWAQLSFVLTFARQLGAPRRASQRVCEVQFELKLCVCPCRCWLLAALEHAGPRTSGVRLGRWLSTGWLANACKNKWQGSSYSLLCVHPRSAAATYLLPVGDQHPMTVLVCVGVDRGASNGVGASAK
jgi:hypothetical protein